MFRHLRISRLPEGPDLIDAIDEELLDAVGIIRQEIIVHVHQGRDLGVYNPPDFEGTNGDGLRLN